MRVKPPISTSMISHIYIHKEWMTRSYEITQVSYTVTWDRDLQNTTESSRWMSQTALQGSLMVNIDRLVKTGVTMHADNRHIGQLCGNAVMTSHPSKTSFRAKTASAPYTCTPGSSSSIHLLNFANKALSLQGWKVKVASHD